MFIFSCPLFKCWYSSVFLLEWNCTYKAWYAALALMNLQIYKPIPEHSSRLWPQYLNTLWNTSLWTASVLLECRMSSDEAVVFVSTSLLSIYFSASIPKGFFNLSRGIFHHLLLEKKPLKGRATIISPLPNWFLCFSAETLNKGAN